ncbi:hypothetical protein LZ32DRAFT_169206 [Colletotrichum eremochloae]|nr:hypothetical protein LZ32DRAFT_169206 [Colletotrichum eremochloae]
MLTNSLTRRILSSNTKYGMACLPCHAERSCGSNCKVRSGRFGTNWSLTHACSSMEMYPRPSLSKGELGLNRATEIKSDSRRAKSRKAHIPLRANGSLTRIVYLGLARQGNGQLGRPNALLTAMIQSPTSFCSDGGVCVQWSGFLRCHWGSLPSLSTGFVGPSFRRTLAKPPPPATSCPRSWQLSNAPRIFKRDRGVVD